MLLGAIIVMGCVAAVRILTHQSYKRGAWLFVLDFILVHLVAFAGISAAAYALTGNMQPILLSYILLITAMVLLPLRDYVRILNAA